MKQSIGYRQSPDGGTRHAHFSHMEPVIVDGEIVDMIEVPDALPKDWVLVEGEGVPGPDPETLKAVEVQERLQAELPELIIANPGADLSAVVAARKAEIEAEVNSAREAPHTA